MPTIPEALANALVNHEAGRLGAAEQIYREILAADPNHADALHLIGVIAFQTGHAALAEQYIRRAIQLNGTEPDYHGNLGNALQAQGKLDQAVASHRRALELDPRSARAHYNLGTALQAQGKLHDAVASYRRALELKPDYAVALYNLGSAFQDLGNLDAAVDCFRRAVALKPDHAEAHNNLSNALKALGKLGEAVASSRRALELKPDYAEAHSNLGNALQALGKLGEAVGHYQTAIELKPGLAEAHNNLGNAFKAQGKLPEALACCRRAVELKPAYAEAHSNLGNVLHVQGRYEDAVSAYRRALELKPQLAEAHYNLGNALAAAGNLDEAVSSYGRALELKPNFPEALNNLGNALRDQGQPAEAIASYERALALNPNFGEAHNNHSMLLLQRGDFERGWPEYEWRWKAGQLEQPIFPQPLWDGQPLDERTILLHAEQGFGDTLQFFRYAEVVKEQNARATVIVECQRRLAKLLSRHRGIDRLVAAGDDLPPFDVHAPLLSLPGILKTRLETIPANVPYLFADPALVDQWCQRMTEVEGLRVGINWHGRTTEGEFRRRDIPLGCFARLAELPGIRLVSVQQAADRVELAKNGIWDPGDDWDTTSGAFMDTAAIMKNLDLVITSDTSIPHLAGGLGVPVWLALPFVADWRFLLDRSDSPWYPNMRLFRQKQAGDWDAVFQEIEAALRSALVRSQAFK